jgi:hypothetical protein
MKPTIALSMLLAACSGARSDLPDTDVGDTGTPIEWPTAPCAAIAPFDAEHQWTFELPPESIGGLSATSFAAPSPSSTRPSPLSLFVSLAGPGATNATTYDLACDADGLLLGGWTENRTCHSCPGWSADVVLDPPIRLTSASGDVPAQAAHLHYVRGYYEPETSDVDAQIAVTQAAVVVDTDLGAFGATEVRFTVTADLGADYPFEGGATWALAGPVGLVRLDGNPLVSVE